MEPEGAEFQDWELLPPNSDSHTEPILDDVADSQELVEPMIQTNYFSLDSPRNHDSEVSSKASDNPSWIDPAFETQYPRKFSAESWSDSGSDRSKSENGILMEGVSSGEDDSLGEGNREREDEIVVRNVEGERKKSGGMVWWKLPIELLRYCVFKGPVWTVSVAAAFMGFVILGRRLYKMKKKKKSVALRPEITMDDKKISQFMSRAARLNEAFSVVKRVPIIRPALPAGGVTPWPVVSLR